MNDRTPGHESTPSDPTEDRLRAAFAARADQVQPADAWPTIAARLDARPSAWTWITQHPLAVGAAAVAVVLIAILTVNLVSGDESAQDLDIVNPPATDYSLVAVTTEGDLVELDLEGEQMEMISSLTDYTSSGDPFLTLGSVAVSRDGAYFLGSVEPDGECPAADQLLTDLWRYPLDLEPGVTLDLGQVASPGGPFAVSPDGSKVAVMTPAETTGHCVEDNHRIVKVLDTATGDELARFDHPDGAPVPVVWLDDDRIAFTASAQVTSAESPAYALAVYDVTTGDVTELALTSVLPMGSLVSPAATSSEQLIATTTSGDPFVEGDEVDDPSGRVQVWRGSIEAGDVELVGEIDLTLWKCPTRDCDAVDLNAFGLTPVSLSEAPDGSVYATVAADPAVIADAAGVGVTSPEDARLFRIASDGTVTQLADGILSVAVRTSTDDEPPASAGDAGPVVGARPDGSIALLDPDTGDVARELVSNDGFPEFAQAGGGEAVLRELAVSPDGGVVWQTRPDGSLATMDLACPDGSTFIGAWDVYGIDAADGSVSPLLANAGTTTGPPSRLPTVSPDGEHLTYVSTSNGTLCDDALVVNVVALDDPDLIVAAHTLPVGVEPAQLVWSDPARLDIVLPIGGSDTPLVPVAVDPLTSGPVSADSPVAFPETNRLAPADGGYLEAFVDANGEGVAVQPTDLYSDVVTEPEWSFVVPRPDYGGSATSLTADGAGNVWVLVGTLDPSSEASLDGVHTWRWDPAAPESDPVDVSDEFIAVAASPFFVPDRAAPDAAGPDGAAGPATSSVAPPSSTPPSSTTADASGQAKIVFVDGEARLRRQVEGEPSVMIADLPVSDYTQVTAIEPTADGHTVYVAYLEDEAEPCLSTLIAVDVRTGVIDPVAGGLVPSVSPDGRHLAYVEGGPAAGASTVGCQERLVVRDLTDGSERRWEYEHVEDGSGPDVPTNEIESMAWGADNRTLYLGIFWTADRHVEIFDTETPEGPFEGDRLQGAGESRLIGAVTIGGQDWLALEVGRTCEACPASEAGIGTVVFTDSRGITGGRFAQVALRPYDVSPIGVLLAGADEAEVWHNERLPLDEDEYSQMPAAESVPLDLDPQLVLPAWLP